MTAPTTPRFNLISEPWLPITRAGGYQMVGLREALTTAPQITTMEGDHPLQQIALHRLLIAVMERAVPGEMPEAWPTSHIDVYLDEHAGRFDLLDPTWPFMQLAGLTPSGRSTGWIPATQALSIVPREPGPLSCADAARGLVEIHAASPGGIRTGTLDDPRTKGGRSYPEGYGWMLYAVPHLVTGPTLGDTLRLHHGVGSREVNRVLGIYDLPVWEHVDTTTYVPRTPVGTADLYTWPSRRVLLDHDGTHVTAARVSNGARLIRGLDDGPRYAAMDPMVIVGDGGDLRASGASYRSRLWYRLPSMGLVALDSARAAGMTVTLHVVRPTLNRMGTAITGTRPETLTVPPCEWSWTMTVAEAGEEAILAYTGLARNLCRAAGRPVESSGDAETQITDELQPTIEQALRGASVEQIVIVARETAQRVLLHPARATIIGRTTESGTYMDYALAEKIFEARLARITPDVT